MTSLVVVAFATCVSLSSRLTDPPLDPSGEEGRRLLHRELVRPEYFDKNLLQRLLDWVQRRADHAVGGAQRASSLSWFVGTLLAVALIAGIVWLVSRARFTARTRHPRAAVLAERGVSAAELRERARTALAEGRFEDAVVDGFRALAAGQVERGRLDDLPDVTAHEVAVALGGEFPASGDAVRRSADLFDAVLYGERTATREQAESVLALDTALVQAR